MAGYQLKCPGVGEYGQGLTAAAVHIAGCCDTFAALPEAERQARGLRIPNGTVPGPPTYDELWAGFQSLWAEREEAGQVIKDLTAQVNTLTEAAATLEDSIREKIKEADRPWNDAVDWLLNSAHCGDPEIQAAFWLLADGGCTRDEASKGFMADGRNIVDAHNDHDGMISHGRRR